MSEQEQTTDEITAFTTAYLNHINAINDYLPRIRNVEYNANTNTTSIYGHTNFEELKVNNNSVALSNHNHDGIYSRTWHKHTAADVYVEEEETLEQALIMKADVGHTHSISDIVVQGEEEETLEDLLDGKADTIHTHSMNQIMGLSSALNGKASSNHNHDSTYAPLSHTHNYAASSHTHAISEITNLQTTLSSLDSKLTTHAYDSTNDTLNSVFTSMPNGSIKVMKEYPDNYWTTAIFKYDSGRSIALSVKKFIESDGDDIRIYWNQWTTDDETNGHVVGTQYSNPGYSNLLTSTNYNHWCAPSVHTHTTADLTNWATATDNFAKLNAANTFTDTNYFNSSVYIFGYNRYHFVSDLPNGSYVYEYIGKANSSGNCARLYYYQNAVLTNRYFALTIHGYDGLRVYSNQIRAYQPIYIYKTSTSSQTPLYIFNSSMANNTYQAIRIGKNDNDENCGFLTYYHVGDNSTSNHIDLEIRGHQNLLSVSSGEVKVKPRLETTNNTAATAIGTNLQTAIKELFDDSNYAKLNAANTFTGYNTFNGTIDNWNNGTGKIIAPIIENGQNFKLYSDEDMIIDFKKMLAQYNDLARIIYTTSGTYNNTLSLDINKSHSIICRVYSDGEGTGNTDYFTTIKHMITLLDGNGKTTLKTLEATDGTFSTSLTVNGQNVLTDDSNYAKLNAINTFTKLTYFNDNVYINASSLFHLRSGMASGAYQYYYIGRSTNNKYSGRLMYYYNSTINNSYLSIGLTGYEGFRFYYDYIKPQREISSSYNITTTADINARNGQFTVSLTAGKIESINSTASDAIGTNLTTAIESLIEAKINAKKDELFQEMYPIGSIYITASIPSNAEVFDNLNDPYDPNVYALKVNIHGCVFQLCPSNTFIKNVNINFSYNQKTQEYSYTLQDDYGTIGGEATHTLTIEEMPYHNHTHFAYSNEQNSGNWGHSQTGNWLAKSTSLTTGYTGGLNGTTQPHNNMPPYFTVFMWRRIE